MMRRLASVMLWAGMLVWGLVADPGAASREHGPALPAATYHRRADAAIQSFLLKFWNPGRNYLNAAYPSNGRLTGYWTYAHGWDAVIENVERTRGQNYAGWIETLYDGQNTRGWHSDFYDDENWMALTLLRAYSVTRDAKYLDQAKRLFSDIRNAWDTSCCGGVPGGIWWDQKHTQKATASNAGPVITACRLYTATGSRSYLDFARQVYELWWGQMVDPATFQVADHINPNGTKAWWKFTYNEGLMIGASRELYTATMETKYLSNGQRVADFMVRTEVVPTRYGPVLFDGANDRCGGDAQEFKAPAYRELCDLCRLSPRTSYDDTLKGSAEALWNLSRSPSLDLFSVDWAGPPQASASDRQQNAAAIALCDFARLQGDEPVSMKPRTARSTRSPWRIVTTASPAGATWRAGTPTLNRSSCTRSSPRAGTR